MQVHSYRTSGGKDLIIDYLDSLPVTEKAEGYFLISLLEEEGIKAFNFLKTRQVGGKLWEIKFYRHKQGFLCAVRRRKYLFASCMQKAKREG